MLKHTFFKLLSVILFFSFFSCETLQIEPELSRENLEGSGDNVLMLQNTTSARVLVNGEPLSYSAEQPYQPAYNDEGTVMVSASAIFEALEWDVEWDGVSRITMRKAGNVIYLWIGNTIDQVNGTNVPLSKAPVLVNNRTMVPSRFVGENAGAKVDWDQETQSVQIYYWNKLDYGIYFYGNEPGTEGSWDAVGNQKFVPGQANSFYNPWAPTVLYIHGFQPGGVENHHRENFHLDDYGVNLHTQNYWKELGYNVAIFHWVQFADDGGLPPDNAELKIYSTTGGVGMRWKNLDGNYVKFNQNKTVADLFADEYQKVFNANYSGGRIHIIGNSLGGNLTMAGVLKLHERGHSANLMPQRITLIDPYWSQNRLYGGSGALPYGANDTQDFGGIAAEMIYQNYNTAIEYFRTSVAGQQGSSFRAIQQAAFTHFGTGYTDVFGTADKHTLPVKQYLWSRSFAPPAEIFRPNAWSPFTPTGNVAASASTSDDRIREMMGQNTGGYKYWNHIDGRDDLDPSNDTFEIREGSW